VGYAGYCIKINEKVSEMIPGPELIYKCPKCGECVMTGSIISGNTSCSIRYSDFKLIAPMLPDFPKITKCKICKTIYWLIGENYTGEVERKKISFVELGEMGIPIGSKLFFFYSDEPIEVELVTRTERDFRVKYNGIEYSISDLTSKIMRFPDTDDGDFEILPCWEYNGKSLEKIYQEFYSANSAKFLSKDEYIEAINLKVYNTEGEEVYLRTRLWWAFNDKVRKDDKFTFSNGDKDIYESNCVKLIEVLNKRENDGRIMCAELYRNLGNYVECKNILKTIHDKEYNWIKELLRKECERNNKNVIVLRDEEDKH